MAKMGSQLGNFIYIENGSGMKEKMSEALQQCLGMALAESSNKEQFMISGKTGGLKLKLKYKQEYTWDVKDEDDDGGAG